MRQEIRIALLTIALLLSGFAQQDEQQQILTGMDVPAYPAEVLSVRADGHVEAYFQVDGDHISRTSLVGSSVSPALTQLRAAAINNLMTWRFKGGRGYSGILHATFDYTLPVKCDLPWSVVVGSAWEVRITPELPCTPQSIPHRQILHFDNLIYPPIARTARIEGVVKAQITISKDGTVADVNPVDGHPMLKAATVENLKRVRFAPAASDSSMVFYLHYWLDAERRIALSPDQIEFSNPPPVINTDTAY